MRSNILIQLNFTSFLRRGVHLTWKSQKFVQRTVIKLFAKPQCVLRWSQKKKRFVDIQLEILISPFDKSGKKKSNEKKSKFVHLSWLQWGSELHLYLLFTKSHVSKYTLRRQIQKRVYIIVQILYEVIAIKPDSNVNIKAIKIAMKSLVIIFMSAYKYNNLNRDNMEENMGCREGFLV